MAGISWLLPGHLACQSLLGGRLKAPMVKSLQMPAQHVAQPSVPAHTQMFKTLIQHIFLSNPVY